MIFRTNHGTENHLTQAQTPCAIRPNRPITLHGFVASRPRTIRGGHVFFTIKHPEGVMECAAFEPTGNLCNVAAKLVAGDEVTVFGGVKNHKETSELTVNLEKIQIHHTAEEFQLANPTCVRCGKHMKSAGKDQGFKCPRCHLKAPKAVKGTILKERVLKSGIYIPIPKAQRHLTKPICRYGQEKNWCGNAPSGNWHHP